MTIHFGLWWLWGALIALYALGLITARGLAAVYCMDVEPPWWVRIGIFFWPLAIPAFLVLAVWHFFTDW